MTKEQQIEEMAVIGCVRNPQAHTAEECAKCDFKQGQCNAYRHAKALYVAGYRKIDGDNYVSREWHDEQVLLAESEIERLRAKLRQVLLSVDTVKEMNTMATIDEHRKQAVKEFAEKLKKRITNTMYCRDGYIDYDDTMDVIDGLSGEFLKYDK